MAVTHQWYMIWDAIDKAEYLVFRFGLDGAIKEVNEFTSGSVVQGSEEERFWYEVLIILHLVNDK